MKFQYKLLSRVNLLSKIYNYSTLNGNTIYALSSGYGKCGVAVIRVSGPHSGIALTKLTNFKCPPKPRTAYLRKIYNPVNRELLDKGLVLWFPGPNSFTGEDCCEFQIHGGAAVISGVLNALGSVPYLRPAEPGEFTRRAFYAGKLDLTEVEGLADLLQAETEIQRRQAILQTEGALKKLYSAWRSILIKSVANIEAHIDFEESESIENDLLGETVSQVKTLKNDIDKHLLDGRKGEILRNGIKTVIIGEPNVGKSSLLNVLCQRPAAIVTPIEGTTRDLLQVTLDINGYPVVLLDTAGLRKNTSDIVEQEGIRRAINSIDSADLVILVVDANKYTRWKEANHKDFFAYLNHYLNCIGLDGAHLKDVGENSQKCIIALNKSDLLPDQDYQDVNQMLRESKNALLISCETGNGFEQFLAEITKHLKDLCGTPTEEHPNMNKDRHRHLLQSCSSYLQEFLSKVEDENEDVVILAQYMRSALRQLGKLTGNVTTDDLLDVIFKDFCIGK